METTNNFSNVTFSSQFGGAFVWIQEPEIQYRDDSDVDWVKIDSSETAYVWVPPSEV